MREAERLARAAGDQVALARIGASVVDALYSDWRPSRARHGAGLMRYVTLHSPVCKRSTCSPGWRSQPAYWLPISSGKPLPAPHRLPMPCCPGCEADAVSATVRGNALGYGLEYFGGQRRWEPAQALVAAIDQLYDDPGFGAVARARVSARRGFYYHYRRGDYAGALGQSISAVTNAQAAGVQRAAREAGITVSLCHLMRGEIVAADRALLAEQEAIPDGHLMFARQRAL